MIKTSKIKYRSKKLRDSAQYEACVSCGANDGTIVWAHSNFQRHGKGMSTKAHDLFGAYLCQHCHNWLDGRPVANIPQSVGRLKLGDWFNIMWERSMIIACEKGYLI